MWCVGEEGLKPFLDCMKRVRQFMQPNTMPRSKTADSSITRFIAYVLTRRRFACMRTRANKTTDTSGNSGKVGKESYVEFWIVETNF